MNDSPYRASATCVAAASTQPTALAPAIKLMAASGVLLGIFQLVLTGWAWNSGAISRHVTLALMLCNAAVYIALAYGTYRRSRISACLQLIYAELHALLVVWLFSPLPAYALLAPLLLLLIMVLGTQAVFRSHRR